MHTLLAESVVTCMISAAGALGFRLLLATPSGHDLAPMCSLFVFIDVVGSLTVLLFWTFAGDIFDAREAKRLFGLIAGGSAVSNVLFGALLAGAADSVLPEDLLYAIATALLICALTVLYISIYCRADLPTDVREPATTQDRTALAEPSEGIARRYTRDPAGASPADHWSHGSVDGSGQQCR